MASKMQNEIDRLLVLAKVKGSTHHVAELETIHLGRERTARAKWGLLRAIRVELHHDR